MYRPAFMVAIEAGRRISTNLRSTTLQVNAQFPVDALVGCCTLTDTGRTIDQPQHTVRSR